MSHPAISIPAEFTLLQAHEYFVRYRYAAFPVIDPAGRVLGMLSIEHLNRTPRRARWTAVSAGAARRPRSGAHNPRTGGRRSPTRRGGLRPRRPCRRRRRRRAASRRRVADRHRASDSCLPPRRSLKRRDQPRSAMNDSCGARAGAGSLSRPFLAGAQVAPDRAANKLGAFAEPELAVYPPDNASRSCALRGVASGRSRCVRPSAIGRGTSVSRGLGSSMSTARRSRRGEPRRAGRRKAPHERRTEQRGRARRPRSPSARTRSPQHRSPTTRTSGCPPPSPPRSRSPAPPPPRRPRGCSTRSPSADRTGASASGGVDTRSVSRGLHAMPSEVAFRLRKDTCELVEVRVAAPSLPRITCTGHVGKPPP